MQMETMCFSIVKMKLCFSDNPLSQPEHFGRFRVTNFKEEITLFSYFKARSWGLHFWGSRSPILWEMAMEGADAFDQSKSAPSTETLFVALGINIWHPGLLLSPLCENEAVFSRACSTVGSLTIAFQAPSGKLSEKNVFLSCSLWPSPGINGCLCEHLIKWGEAAVLSKSFLQLLHIDE